MYHIVYRFSNDFSSVCKAPPTSIEIPQKNYPNPKTLPVPTDPSPISRDTFLFAAPRSEPNEHALIHIELPAPCKESPIPKALPP